jgi:hypothetical protein
MRIPFPFLVPPGVRMHGNDESPKPVISVSGQSDTTSRRADQGTELEPLLREIRQKHGEALLAILVYGSWLRGKRDTMLDFYVLVEDYRSLKSGWQALMCRLLPPNVYHIHHRSEDPEAAKTESRAKYALLTLKRFRHAMQHDFHSYFWARFAQPCEVLYVRDDATQAVLNEAFSSASNTFILRVVPAMEKRFSSAELWTRGLSLTYQCELRTESSNRGDSIYEFDPGHYDRVTSLFADQHGSLLKSEPDNIYRNLSSGFNRKLASFTWWLRRIQGKLLSLLRLSKAAFTFNDALEYLLWKIERHTGLYIEPTQRQLKHPLIFAWPLLWKLYRQGAFR